MTNFRMLLTNEGPHPAAKWADVTVDDIMEIASTASGGLLKEATEFRDKLRALFARHHQTMIDHEKREIKQGRHTEHHAYLTEDHAKVATGEVGALAKGTSFEGHFKQQHVKDHVEYVCNHYFKSAKHVERQHFWAEQAEHKTNNKKG